MPNKWADRGTLVFHRTNPCPGPGTIPDGSGGSLYGVGPAWSSANTIGSNFGAVGQIESCGVCLPSVYVVGFKLNFPRVQTKATLVWHRIVDVPGTETVWWTDRRFEPYPRGRLTRGKHPVVLDYLGDIDMTGLGVSACQNYNNRTQDPLMLQLRDAAALTTFGQVMQAGAGSGVYNRDVTALIQGAQDREDGWVVFRWQESPIELQTNIEAVEWVGIGAACDGGGRGPRLTYDPTPSGQKPVKTNPLDLSLTLTPLVPCVTLEGTFLDHLQDRPDWGRGIVLLRRGNTVHVEVALLDHETVPATYIDATLRLTLVAEDGTVVVNDQAMRRVKRGIYGYEYPTLITDPPGLYRAFFKADL